MSDQCVMLCPVARRICGVHVACQICGVMFRTSAEKCPDAAQCPFGGTEVFTQKKRSESGPFFAQKRSVDVASRKRSSRFKVCAFPPQVRMKNVWTQQFGFQESNLKVMMDDGSYGGALYKTIIPDFI